MAYQFRKTKKISVRVDEDLLQTFMEAVNLVNEIRGNRVPMSRTEAITEVMKLYVEYSVALKHDMEKKKNAYI